MKRRELIQSGLAASMLAAGYGVLPTPAFGKARRDDGDNGLANSERSGVTAWRDAYPNVRPGYEPVTVRFDRPLPAGLQGTLYRNGPALMQRGATAFTHWFDGDALVHSYRIGGDRLTHQARMVRTERFEAEQQAGRYLWDGFGTSFADARPTNKADDLNVANISVLPVRGELLALWEGGSPYRLDPQTLQTRGRKTFSAETDRMPFSAHPRIDRDGTIWSFGYLTGTGKLVLYRLDAGGQMRQVNVIEAPNADMVHDFAITDRFLVFSLMPLIAQPRDRYASALQRYQWQPKQASVVMLIEKSTLQVAHRIEMPAPMQFHLGNAWDDGQTVRIQTMRIGDYHGLMNAMYSAVAGRPAARFNSPDDGIAELVVDLDKRRVDVMSLAPGAQDFPAWDKRRTGLATDKLVSLRTSASVSAGSFAVNELALVDRQRHTVASWDYGAQTLAEEHLFVGKPDGKPESGWVLGSRYDWRSQRTTLSVFDVRDIGDGPIASAELPYGFPPGLHGAFVPG